MGKVRQLSQELSRFPLLRARLPTLLKLVEAALWVCVIGINASTVVSRSDLPLGHTDWVSLLPLVVLFLKALQMDSNHL